MTELPEVGGRMILQKGGVRVWKDTVQPGDIQPLHVHQHPYVAIAIAGERGDTVGPGGETAATYEIEPGEVFWYGPESLPATHALRNSGTTPIVVVIVELL